MTFKLAAASVVALNLFLAPVVAPAFAQEGEAPAAVDAGELLQAATNLVNDRRTSQELSDDELKQRARKARQLLKAEGLPDDLKPQLQAIVETDRAELEARTAAAKPAEPAPETVQEAAPQPEAAPAPKVEEQAQQPEAAPDAAIVAAIPQPVTDLMADFDNRPAADLSDEELAARAKLARQFARDESLPPDLREKLAIIAKDARQTIASREKAAAEKKAAQEAPPAPQPETVQEAAPQPQPDAAPVVETPPETKAAEPAPVVETPPETKAAEPVAPPTPPAVDKVEAKELDGNAGDPEAEKRAAAYLEDATPADSLNDDDLRKRLDGMRDLMAENELSQKTERALRNKLRTERDILRARLAKAKDEEAAKLAAAAAAAAAPQAEAAPAAKADKKPKINIIINADTPIRQILRDRREAEVLDDSELRYRIRARRDFETSEQYRNFDDEQRQAWTEETRRDRSFLRRKLEDDRNIRRSELKKSSNIRKIVIEDEEDFNDDIPEDVFAAEVEDEDIERALLAPPRKKIIRKVAVEEIAAQPKLRASLTRIEVDTIRFGFNEAFVREEEVDNLDQIASVIERVLTKYPREVFLIEGHTDAVGSDPYNDKLSKARAEAVKKALSTYYIIPAKNLKTVGLGERYLKIPTAEAEGENRRVSISRATAMIGEADE